MYNRLRQRQRKGRSRRRKERLGAKLSRKAEGSPIELVSGRDVGAIGRGGAEAEENPREMVKPVSIIAAGVESHLKAVVKTFNKAIGLGMVGSGRLMRYVKMGAKRDPEGRGELRTMVRSDNVWHTKVGDPMMHQSSGAVIIRGGGQRVSFRPMGSAVNNGEKICVTRRGRERTHQIHMNVQELTGWERNGCQAKVSMAVDLSGLASQTSTAPGGDIFGQAGPHIVGREKAAGSPNAQVSKAVNMLEEDMAERLRNKRTENRSRDITKQRSVANHVSVKLKSRRNLESLYFRGKHLLLGKVKRGKRRIHREQSSNQRRWR